MLGWQGGTSTGLEEHTESLVLLAVESGGWSFHSALLWHANVAVSCALGKDCRVTMIQRCPLKKHDDSKMMSIICIYITHNRWDNNLSISMIFCDNLSIYIIPWDIKHRRCVFLCCFLSTRVNHSEQRRWTSAWEHVPRQRNTLIRSWPPFVVGTCDLPCCPICSKWVGVGLKTTLAYEVLA